MTLVASRPPLYPEIAVEMARCGITVADLSHAVGCHSSYLSQVLNGHATPSAALRQRIADALDRPAGELFVESEMAVYARRRVAETRQHQGLSERPSDEVLDAAAAIASAEDGAA